VPEGTSTIFAANKLLDQYLQALATEKSLALPSSPPDVLEYTLALGRYGAGGMTYAQLQAARDAYVAKVLAASKPVPHLDRAAAVKRRLDAAIAAKAPQATIDALKAEYQKQLANQTTAAQNAVTTAIASKAPTSAVAALQTRLDAAKTEEASGKLATNPMKEILTFAIMTSPAWLTLLMLRYKMI
jgi:hypothetical protein